MEAKQHLECVMEPMDSLDLSNMLDMLASVPSDLRNAWDVVHECEDETMDILHDLEISEHSYHERAKLAVRITELRRRRREAKNAVERLTPLCEWIESNQNAMNSLKKTLGSMRKAEHNAANRVYIRRAGEEKGKLIV